MFHEFLGFNLWVETPDWNSNCVWFCKTWIIENHRWVCCWNLKANLIKEHWQVRPYLIIHEIIADVTLKWVWVPSSTELENCISLSWEPSFRCPAFWSRQRQDWQDLGLSSWRWINTASTTTTSTSFSSSSSTTTTSTSFSSSSTTTTTSTSVSSSSTTTTASTSFSSSTTTTTTTTSSTTTTTTSCCCGAFGSYFPPCPNALVTSGQDISWSLRLCEA